MSMGHQSLCWDKGSQGARESHNSECGVLPKEAKFWGLLGACCTLPRKNVHDTRMNINHLFCALYLYVKHCLSILHINIICITTYEVGTIIIPILQI